MNIFCSVSGWFLVGFGLVPFGFWLVSGWPVVFFLVGFWWVCGWFLIGFWLGSGWCRVVLVLVPVRSRIGDWFVSVLVRVCLVLVSGWFPVCSRISFGLASGWCLVCFRLVCCWSLAV